MSSLPAVVVDSRPRILLEPPDVAATSGPEVADLAALAGLLLDDHQRLVLDVGLSERADGRWSAMEVGVVEPRQNGKGSILEALELGALFLFDEELIIHSAHEFRTAKEHFRRIQGLIQGCEELREQVKKVLTGNEDVSIEMRNGKRLRFMARSGKSARGFTGDRIILDEAFHLDAETMGAMLPTLSTVPNPQVWYASSAPLATSSHLHAVRRRALQPINGDRLAYLEWSAAETFDEVDLDDRDAWYRSNPALGLRITEDFVANERRTLSGSPEVFARERLGVPDRPADEIGETTITAAWRDRLDSTAAPADPVSLAFDVTPEHDRASIVACGTHDGAAVVELIANEAGTGWVVAKLAGIIERHRPAMIVADLRGPAGSLAADLTRAGIEVRAVTPAEHGQACGLFQENTPLHRGQPELAAAVAGAARRPMGDTWLWSRRSSKVDISPLVAATLAHWAHRQPAVASVGVVNLADYLEDDDE